MLPWWWTRRIFVYGRKRVQPQNESHKQFESYLKPSIPPSNEGAPGGSRGWGEDNIGRHGEERYWLIGMSVGRAITVEAIKYCRR